LNNPFFTARVQISTIANLQHRNSMPVRAADSSLEIGNTANIFWTSPFSPELESLSEDLKRLNNSGGSSRLTVLLFPDSMKGGFRGLG